MAAHHTCHSRRRRDLNETSSRGSEKGRHYHLRAANMNVHHSLISFFFLMLWDRDTGLISAEKHIYTGSHGGNITVQCVFIFSGGKKIFCKEPCGVEDILITTTNVTAQSGRYSIVYEEGFFLLRPTILNVSITKLTESDTRSYRCGLKPFFLPPRYTEFEIRVGDASISSKPTSVSSTSSTSPMSTTQCSSSSSRSSTHLPVSSEATKQTHQQQTTPAPAVLLYLGLTLVVLIAAFITAVLTICKRRAATSKKPPVEPDINLREPQASQALEEVRDTERSAGELSAVYAKPNRVNTTDEYSLLSAAFLKTEEPSSQPIYSEVDFSAIAASHTSAPFSDADTVIYSVPRVDQAGDTSPAMPITVTLQQL